MSKRDIQQIVGYDELPRSFFLLRAMCIRLFVLLNVQPDVAAGTCELSMKKRIRIRRRSYEDRRFHGVNSDIFREKASHSQKALPRISLPHNLNQPLL